MAVGSNRLYLFRKIQNNLQSPVHTKRFHQAEPYIPLTSLNKPRSPTLPISSVQELSRALSSKFRYIGVHASEAVLRDPAPRRQSGDGIRTR